MLQKNGKKITGIMFMALVIIIAVLSGTHYVSAKSKTITVNKKNFPDKVLRREIGFELGDKMTKSDLKDVDYLNLDGGKRKINFKGLTYFPELSELLVTERAKNLKLPNLPKLEVFQYHNDRITDLNLRKLPKLEWAYFEGKELVKLDLSKNKQIRQLTLYAPKLANLDIKVFKNLEMLELEDLKLTKLDLSGNQKIYYLSLKNMKGITLNLKSLPELETLVLENSDLETLELSNYKNLKYIEVSGCDRLKKINVQGCAKLKDLKVKKNPLLQEISVDDRSKLTSLVVSGCKKVTNLDNVNLSKLKQLEVVNTSVSNLSPDRFPNLGELVFYKNRQVDIDFRPLKKLYSLEGGYEKSRKVLDVSMLPKLHSLSWTNGVVEHVKFGKKSRFQDIDLSGNRLSGAWDLSKFNNIETFICDNNRITSIDLGKMTQNLMIYCRNNKLKKFNASYCSNLSELDTRGNTSVKVYMHSSDSECMSWKFGKTAKVYYQYN